MKKTLALIALAASITLGVSAQQPYRFSVFANPCINWFDSDVRKVQADGPTIGFDAGLTSDYFFAENYAFSSGISIGSLGGKLRYENPTAFNTISFDTIVKSGTTVKYSLQYITIPVGLKFKTKEIGYFTYFAHLGLTNQINIKARASSDETIKPALDSDNISDNIFFFNMGYHFGGGVYYSLGGQTALIFGLTYTKGFVDLTSHKEDKITSNSLALRLGLLF